MKMEKKHILAVDDQVSNTRMVKLYLERTNDYVVREVNNAKPRFPRRRNFSRT